MPLRTSSRSPARESRSRRIATHGRPVTACTANSRPPPGSGTDTRGEDAVEAALLDPAAGGDRADQVGQLLVAGRDRRDARAAAVGVLDEHLVAPVGVNGLDLGVVQVGLEAAQAPQVGVDRGPRPAARRPGPAVPARW